MKVRKMGVVILFAFLVAGCTKEEMKEIPKVETEAEMIRMKPAVSTLQPASRVPFTEAVGGGVLLTAWVPASVTQGDYNTLYANGTMTFNEVSDPVVYDTTGFSGNNSFPEDAETPVYLRGFYPAMGWTKLVGSNQTTISLTGKDDVMVAPQVSTTKKKVREGTFATLEFEHQLTLLEIVIQTEGDKAVAKWKEVSGITVKKPAGQIETLLTVNLSTGAATFGNLQSSLPTFALSVNEDVTSYTNDNYAGTSLVAGKSEKVAYVLAPPVSATSTNKEYAFSVTTLKDGVSTVSTVSVDLNAVDDSPFTGSTAGYSFVVTFYFLSGELSAVATVKEWEKGGTSVVPVE